MRRAALHISERYLLSCLKADIPSNSAEAILVKLQQLNRLNPY